MGGRLWVDSVYEKGSTFSFTCITKVAPPDLQAVWPQLRAYKNHGVLFVDRGRTACANDLSTMLKVIELDPIVVNHEDEIPKPVPGAPSKAEHSLPYDVILVDGMDTAVRVRNHDALRYVPIVLLAPVVSVSMKSALDLGVASYMTTPCKLIDLANGMIPALEGRQTTSISDASKSFDILLAEDNQVNQKVAVKILQKYNHGVTVANNGQEALDAIKTKRYDVILMDVQMPIMGGFEATKEIREYERSEGLTRTPIIALTAHAMMGDREKCIQAQMDEYLTKPLKQQQMMQTILKCATLGGKLLHSGKEARVSAKDASSEPNKNSSSHSGGTGVSRHHSRPSMESRAITSAGPVNGDGNDSPGLLSAEMQDPMTMERVSVLFFLASDKGVEQWLMLMQILLRSHSS